MKDKYIDTHCHLGSDFFKNDVNQEISNSLQLNIIYLIVPSTNEFDTKKSIALSKSNKNVFAAAGIHPLNVTKYNLDFIEKINKDEIVAIGETGIDLYHKNAPKLFLQKKSFINHIKFAKKHDLPIIVHSRNSFCETYEIMKKYPNLKYVMHSFTGDLKIAKKFIKIGAFISFSGILTFKNAKKLQEVAKNIESSKILIETDSPFLSPEPFRGKMNIPSNVIYIAHFIKKLRFEKNIIEIIYINSIDLFKIG